MVITILTYINTYTEHVVSLTCTTGQQQYIGYYFILLNKAACLQMSKHISINQTCEKCTKILQNVERVKIQVIIYKFWAINGEIFLMCNYISTALLTHWGVFLVAYFVIKLGCKCHW
jgi:hypothetical protein